MEEPTPTDGDDGLLTRYLLGDLADEERDRLQKTYFEDDALFARLLAAEDDLIDAYVKGSLTAAERRRFEERFGRTPGQLRRLDFSRLLQRAGDGQAATSAVPASQGLGGGRHGAARPRPRPTITWAAGVAAAGLLFTAVGLAWWASQRKASPVAEVSQPAVAPVNGRENAARPEVKTPAPAARTQGPALPMAVASVVLRAGMVRGTGRAPELLLTPTTRWAELQLDLDHGEGMSHARYEVVVETAAGTEVAREDGLERREAARPSVTVRVPAALLSQKDYVVLLSGTHADGTRVFLRGYSFRVTR